MIDRSTVESISLFIVIGLSFSVVILLKQLNHSGNQKPFLLSPVFLAFICTLELLYGWLFSTKYILDVPHLLRLNTPFLYLLGPSLYFLILSNGQPNRKWFLNDLLHLIPFVLAILFLLPFYLFSTEAKVVYIQHLYEQLGSDSLWLGGSRRIHQGIYLGASIAHLVKASKAIRFYKMWTASKWIIIIFSTIWAISIYRFFFQFDLMSAMVDIFLLSTVAIFLVYRQLSLRKPATSTQQLDVDRMVLEKQRIEQLLENEQVYKDPQYSVKDLAKALNLSVRDVSQIINRGMQTNFNQLVNKYKIEEAIRLLRREDTQHLTIEAIAHQAGFNSTSALNDNFRKLTGQTPKAYRQDILPKS